MVTWSSNQRVCATCRYWCGRREIDFTQTFFCVDNDEKGKCAGPLTNSFCGVIMNHGASCNGWDSF